MLPRMTVSIVSATTRDADLERLLAVRNAVDPRHVTPAGYRAEVLGATFRSVIAVEDGRDVGAGDVGWREWGVENRTAAVHVWVLPDARGRGIGTALIADLATYARDAGMEHWLSNALEDDERSLRFADRLGLQRGPAGQAGFLDLASANDPPVTRDDGADDDVVLTTYADRADLAREMYDLEVRVAPEIPALSEETPPTYETWSAETADDPGFVRDLSVLAVSGDRLVGAISIYDLGDRTAYIGMTAVHPEARRRGIARRMKEDLTRRARAAGWQRLMTYNDGDNEAIRVLNEHLGYVYLPRVIRLKGPIPPDEVRR